MHFSQIFMVFLIHTNVFPTPFVSCLLEEDILGQGITNDDILHRLQLLEQQNNLQTQQIDTQQQKMTDLLNEIQTMKSQHSSDIQAVQTENTYLQKQIETLQNNNEDVSFFAYLQQDIDNPRHGQTIVFNSVMTDTGKAYDPSHGVFTAPVNGTYYLSFAGSLPPRNEHDHILHMFITVNGNKRVAYVFLDHNQSFWLERSSSTVVHLDKGDRVWVVSLYGQGTLAGYDGDEDKIHSYFSGFLIHGD